MTLSRRSLIAWVFGLGALLCAGLSVTLYVPAYSQATEDEAGIAKSLAAMLRAGRTVISAQQDRINDASLGFKSLGSKAVLAEQDGTEVSPEDLVGLEVVA